jgi:hypothetical protein
MKLSEVRFDQWFIGRFSDDRPRIKLDISYLPKIGGEYGGEPVFWMVSLDGKTGFSTDVEVTVVARPEVWEGEPDEPESEFERPIPFGEAPGDALLFDEAYPLTGHLKGYYSQVKIWERNGEKHHVFSCHPQTTEAKEGTGILSFEP